MSAETHTRTSDAPRPRWLRRVVLAALAVSSAWALAAYLVLPFALRHYEHQQALAGFEMVTRTAQGLAGDPLNVGIVGSREELVAAMTRAGWFPADPVTLRTSVDIVGSVVLDRPYPQAPVSPLFYQGRQQDLAFEKAVGTSADRRQHVRFWNVLPSGAEGRSVWLGSASFDVGVGFSHYTGAVTHAIDPNVDAMRDALSADLARTGRIIQTYEISGVGPTLDGRNGEGDRYVTDGEVRVSVIAPAGQAGRNPPPTLTNPPIVDLKNAL
ncbi:LssY C-terminal domain-containing protein [Antarcticirhabdus aurantiaca]|uniref:LssY C-terminal domain-containing protein n=1 Tax=Antarcticirhabdus aurantiaca TaxID=2606717 RepID=A0ACD4NMB4_9HYPH|nr:LssY C-terminal domain-containing protein [Antarcticirhabdus aurantiaca]WAJ27796.1 LssY C-terminal domain-containing protein [Jeongeuplla avenae]